MKKYLALFLLLAVILSGCVQPSSTTSAPTTGAQLQIPTTIPPTTAPEPTVPPTTQPIVLGCSGHDADPYEGVTKEAFYADYTTACCYEDAQYRSEHGFLSGSLEIPGQEVTRAGDQPMAGGLYVRNTDNFYADDGNTYIITNGYGYEVARIYRGGGYITLEEVAAYMYAFGGSAEDLPANYTANKKGDPDDSIWGEYLRLNHTQFKFNPSKYPYEPALPNILNSLGGKLQYFEMDIGTTGTETPGYSTSAYNDGHSISRGAARLVYARNDLNGNGIYEQGEVYIFFTHNHYNDFTEYLNYYGGWGKTFGNVTGGGTYNSKTDYNPTPYPEVVYADLSQWENAA